MAAVLLTPYFCILATLTPSVKNAASILHPVSFILAIDSKYLLILTRFTENDVLILKLTYNQLNSFLVPRFFVFAS